jgi:HK97 family phage prohead protease
MHRAGGHNMLQFVDLGCAYETKAVADDVASITGIASTAHPDQHNDLVEAGAFEPIGDSIKMLRDHDRSQIIGGWKSFKQDGKQLKVEGELCLAANPKAQETYELLKRGYIDGLSVGFNIKPGGAVYEDKTLRRTIKKAELMECSIVAFPANKGARVRNVKDLLGSQTSTYDWLTDTGFNPGEIEILMRKGFDALIAERMAEERGRLQFKPIEEPPAVDDDELPDDLIEKKDPAKPYGDVAYADPGYQDDGKKRYPIDTEAHIRAAWNYINKPKNAGKYSGDEVSKIKGRIVAAWKRKIDPKGPPSAEKDYSADEVATEVRGFLRTILERA